MCVCVFLGLYGLSFQAVAEAVSGPPPGQAALLRTTATTTGMWGKRLEGVKCTHRVKRTVAAARVRWGRGRREERQAEEGGP